MAIQIPNQHFGIEMCLFKLIGANMNVTTDQVFTPIGNIPAGAIYEIGAIRVLNASTSLTTAAGGVYNAITKPAGGIIVAAAQAYSTLTGATLGLNLTLTALGVARQTGIPYLSLTTGQGGAATADLYLHGRLIGGDFV